MIGSALLPARSAAYRSALVSLVGVCGAFAFIQCSSSSGESSDPSGGDTSSSGASSGSNSAGAGTGGSEAGTGGVTVVSGSGGSTGVTGKAGAAGSGTGGAGAAGSGTGGAGTASSGTGGGSNANAMPSPGCGKAEPAGATADNAGNTYVKNAMVTVDNVTYPYGLSVPSTYKTGTPYPLVFWWHGSHGGGDGDHEAMKWDMEKQMPGIYFYPTCPDGDWDLSGDSIDVHLFDKMYADITNNYCVDMKRVFSMGFSQGGYFTNVLACARGDKIRGAAPESGGSPPSNCKGPVAWVGTHGLTDGTVNITSQGRAARDGWLKIDGCQMTSTPYNPQPMPHTDVFAGDKQPTCVKYDCPAADPVHWCEFDDGHTYQVWPHYVTAAFFKALP